MHYLYVLLRCATIFIFMSFILRILGKKEVGQFTIFDLVVVLIISDLASLGIDGTTNFISTILCLILLIILQKILSYILLKCSKLRNIIENKPTIIVKDGNLMYLNMQKESYTVDDLITQLRGNLVMDVKEVKLAILESNGTLSVFKKDDYNTINLPVIKNGVIDKSNCDFLNIDENFILNNIDCNLVDIIYASSDGKNLFISNKI